MRLALTMALALTACTHNDRADTLHTALVTVDATRDGFLVYDATAQARIVETAATGSAARQGLVDYRAERDRATGPGGLLVATYRALAAAGAANDATTLSAAESAVLQLVAAVKPYLVTGASK